MRLENLVEKFIENDCAVRFGDEFLYDPNDETIYITLEEDNEANTEWREYLANKFNFQLTNENLFVMSILHELGHHYTINLFTDEEWTRETSEKYLEGLEGSERFQTYFDKPIERAATDWAVQFYRINPEYMRAWSHRLNCALRHYEKLYNTSTTLLMKF